MTILAAMIQIERGMIHFELAILWRMLTRPLALDPFCAAIQRMAALHERLLILSIMPWGKRG